MRDSVKSVAEFKIKNILCSSLIHSPFHHLRSCAACWHSPGSPFPDNSVPQCTSAGGEELTCPILVSARDTKQPPAPELHSPSGAHSRGGTLMGQGQFLQGWCWGLCIVMCYHCCPACEHCSQQSFWLSSVLYVLAASFSCSPSMAEP